MLNERDRAVLYHRLTHLVGDPEAVGAMLSHFPPTEGERLVTESMLHAEVQAVRTEIQAVRTDMYAMGNRIILWNIGFTMTWSGVLLAAIKFT